MTFIYDKYLVIMTYNVVRVVKYLEGMSGRQVLGMKKEDLETAFGEHEGKRLDSQITLSRSHQKRIFLRFGSIRLSLYFTL